MDGRTDGQRPTPDVLQKASRINSTTGSEWRVVTSAMPSAVRTTDFIALKAMIQTRSPGRRAGGRDDEGNVDMMGVQVWEVAASPPKYLY